MQCNIDARGKAVRLVGGCVCLAIAVVLAILAMMHLATFWAMMGPAIGLGVAGAFQIFEGWAGWCAIRAMGFKTRV